MLSKSWPAPCRLKAPVLDSTKRWQPCPALWPLSLLTPLPESCASAHCFSPWVLFLPLGDFPFSCHLSYVLDVRLVSLYLAFQETSDQSVSLYKLTHLTPTHVDTWCIADAQHCFLSSMPAQPHLSHQPLLSHWNSHLQREVFIIPLPRLGSINSISSTHIHSTPTVTCPGYLASSLLWMKGFLEIPPAPCGLQATAWSFKTDLNF